MELEQRSSMSFRLGATRSNVFCLVVGTLLGLAPPSHAQTPAPGASASDSAADDNRKQAPGNPTSVEVPAVNYSRGGESKTEFSSTALMPGATGQARVKMRKEGSVSVDAQFIGLESPTTFGNDLLIYILWACVPKGRTYKIGAIVLNGSGGQIEASTVLHTFAMLVTAEPYGAVTQPSNVVVLKGGSLNSDPTQTVSTHVELLVDAYSPPGYRYEPLDTSSGYPSELLEAMNARRIAKEFKADKYAPEQFENAEGLYHYVIGSGIQQKKTSKKLLQVARVVAESYEEARSVSVRRQKNRKKQ